MTKQMTLKIRVDNGMERAQLVIVLAANGFWVKEIEEEGSIHKRYYILVKGEFEVVEG